ncbi:UNVERIFIED_CONTAM: hypothetical protein K2H54_011141 [Gekko kuhli]
MPNRKRRRSSSDVTNLKEVKQQRIDKFVTNTQPGAVQLSNKYAVLAENLQTAPCEEEEKSLAEISMQQQCCQQLLSTIMELFSKEAILTSQSLALLLDKINNIVVKVSSLEEAVNNLIELSPGGSKDKTVAKPVQTKGLVAEESMGKRRAFSPNKNRVLSRVFEPGLQGHIQRREMKPGQSPKILQREADYTEKFPQSMEAMSHKLNSTIRQQEEHLEAEIPLRLLSPNCQEWETHGIQEIELDLRSHQVITMSSGAPIEVKSLALELKEAEADQARVQQFQSIAREVKPKEAERKLSWPVKEAQVPQNTNKRSTELQFYQGGERALLASSLQEEMLDNSTEEEFYNMFADLTPQEQQAVTKRLEYTKNCLLARKKDERFKQQAIQDDNMVNSSTNVLTQTLQVTKLLPSSEVEMDIEQEINGSSAANVDFLQTTKNGSIFIDRDRILDQINESE